MQKALPVEDREAVGEVCRRRDGIAGAAGALQPLPAVFFSLIVKPWDLMLGK
jgi:hypothetical protein